MSFLERLKQSPKPRKMLVMLPFRSSCLAFAPSLGLGIAPLPVHALRHERSVQLLHPQRLCVQLGLLRGVLAGLPQRALDPERLDLACDDQQILDLGDLPQIMVRE